MKNENAYGKKLEKDFAILTGLTLLAIVSRVYGVWEWSLSGDEYHTVMRASERYKNFVNPAYYALVLGSFKLFGVTEWSSRLPAMLLGILSVPIFYLTWRNVFGRYAAFVGSLIILFSSWHLYYSQFSRFYTGAFLFGSLSYFLYYNAISRDKLGSLVWAIIANVVGTLFHATSFLVTVACALFSLIVFLSSEAKKSGYSRRIAGIHLAISIGGGLISAPFLFNIAKGWGGMEQTWGYGPLILGFQTIKYFQPLIAISALIGAILLSYRDVLKGIFFIVGICVPFIALLAASALIPPAPPRYIFFVLPMVYALAAYLCDQVRISFRNNRIYYPVLTIILLVSILPETVSHYTGKQSLNSKQAVEFVKNAYLPGDQIRTFKGAYKYYFGDSYPVDSRYLGSSTNNNVKWREILETYKDGEGRVWFILDVYRTPLAKGIEDWLMENASLVWRKFEKRYDYNVTGIEIWLMEGSNIGIQHK